MKLKTCTEDGHIKSHCDLCDSDNTEYIDKGHVFEIMDENEEKIVKKCSVCNEEKIEKKESKKDTESKPSDDKKDENKPSSDDKQTSSNEDKHKHKLAVAVTLKVSL